MTTFAGMFAGGHDLVRLRFREEKTTQAAAHLLKRAGGSLPYMSLIKLLYLADRRALVELGRPISYDLFVCMPQGPVLSRTLDLITEEPDPQHPSYWHQFIAPPHEYAVRLLKPAPNDQLSRAEEDILDAVQAQYGRLGRWQLRELTHTLPEWRDPQGSSVPIDVRDVLVHQGVSPEDAEAIVRDLAAEAEAERLTE